jgi:hypothetical protein
MGVPMDDDEREHDRKVTTNLARPVMRVDLEVPDGVELRLIINGIEMDLDD